MKTVGIRELKQNASKVIADVVAGEVVTVTSHGRPVAQISPLAKDTVRGLIDSGQAPRQSTSSPTSRLLLFCLQE